MRPWIAIVLVFLLTPHPAQATEPPALILEWHESDATRRLAITDASGLLPAPAAGVVRNRWAIRAGSSVEAPAPPRERLVAFYRGSDAQRQKVFEVRVRWFPATASRDRWVPAYQMHEEALVVRDARGIRPVALPGAEGLITLTGPSLPNADGFYPALELGTTAGRIEITSWSSP